MGGEKAIVPQHYDEEAGLHFIKGNRYILFENGVIVARKDFDNRIANGKTLSRLVMEAMQVPENCGWDYRHAVSTTYLERGKGGKKMEVTPDVPTVDIAMPKMEEPEVVPKETAVEEQKENTAPDHAPSRVSAFVAFMKAPYTDIILMLSVVGVLCVAMSIYHTNRFLLDSGKLPIVAITAAVSMVIFSASAFTAARHIFADKGINFLARLVFSAFLIVSGVFVIAYSVFSTTSVSYDQYRAKRDKIVEVAVTNDSGVKLNSERSSAKDASIAEAKSDVDQYTRDSLNFYSIMTRPLPQLAVSDDPAVVESSRRAVQTASSERSLATKNYDKVQARLDAAKARLQKLQDEKYSLLDEKSQVIQTVRESQSTAYKLVSDKLGIAEDTLQFIIYVIPAAFFDVVAPFAVAIVLLLKDRRSGVVARKEKSYLQKLLDKVLDRQAEDVAA